MWGWFAIINSANTSWGEKSSQGAHLQERIRRGIGGPVAGLKPNRRQQAHTVVKKKFQSSYNYLYIYILDCSLQDAFSEPSPPFGLCNWAGCHTSAGTQHFQRDVTPWSKAGGMLQKGQWSSQRDKWVFVATGDMMGGSELHCKWGLGQQDGFLMWTERVMWNF